MRMSICANCEDSGLLFRFCKKKADLRVSQSTTRKLKAIQEPFTMFDKSAISLIEGFFFQSFAFCSLALYFGMGSRVLPIQKSMWQCPEIGVL